MKKLKTSLVAAMVGVVLLAGNSISVNAEEANTIICNQETADQTDISVVEQAPIMESYILPDEIGESIMLDEDENGKLYVTLTAYEESKTRSSNKTSQAQYTFNYENALGVTKVAFRVNLVCHWTENGLNSKIIDLVGNFSDVASGYTCEWIDSYYSECQCWLDARANYTYEYRFAATLVPLEENPTLTIKRVW